MPLGMSDQREDVPPDSSVEQTDEQLMVAFARGSADAFDVLFRRYRQPIYAFFRRRVADVSAAEELAQETFLAVLQAAATYQACALFRTYLYAIGFRILRSHRRKFAIRAMFWKPLDAKSEPAARAALETEIEVRRALKKLDGTEREILMLREFEQLSYAEIAGILGLPLNTMRTRLFRARGALRELLSARAPASASEKIVHSEERA